MSFYCIQLPTSIQLICVCHGTCKFIAWNEHSFGDCFILMNSQAQSKYLVFRGTCKLRNGKKRKETKRKWKEKKRKENKEKSNEKKRKKNET